MNRQSKRFTPSKWADRLVPVVLALVALVLVAIVVMVVLSTIGILPGGL